MLMETEKLLLSCLKGYGLGPGKAAMIGTMMETDEQRAALAEFLMKNEDATEQQIVDEALRLAQK